MSIVADGIRVRRRGEPSYDLHWGGCCLPPPLIPLPASKRPIRSWMGSTESLPSMPMESSVNCHRSSACIVVLLGTLMLIGCNERRYNERDSDVSSFSEKNVTFGDRREKSAFKNDELAQAGYSLLNGVNIRLLLSGKVLEVNKSKSPNSIFFTENFRNDGFWISTRLAFTPMERQGSWRIDRDKLCVQQIKYGLKCRHVWYNPDDHSFAMTDIAKRARQIVFLNLSK